MNLDRFAEGLPDSQAKDPELLGHCDNCGEPIYEGDTYVTFDGDIFCSTNCLADALGATIVD